MSLKKYDSNSLRTEAEKMMELLNLLTLFSRKTLLEWLPSVTAEFGFSEERFMVLYELDLQPNSSLKDLARNLMVSSSSLSIMINALVEQELVERVTDPLDRRRVLLKLSHYGETMLGKANTYLVQCFQEYLKGLAPETRRELETAGDAMAVAVKHVMKESMEA